MDIFETVNRFPTQQVCIDYLEAIRFKNGAYCPHCGSMDVARKKEPGRIGRWNCHDCKSSFNVLSDTIFEHTQIPLPKWFAAIAMMLDAKKSISSPQLARHLGINQKAAWYMQQRIRAGMASDQAPMLSGIIEADETYVGGKPRKSNKKNQRPHKRGKGTDKTPVIGAVERDGNVIAQVADDLTGRGVLKFVMNTVRPDAKIMITDENKAYNVVRSMMPHGVVNHQQEYVNGPFHTNTIEGFWSLLKRAWYGTHHKYSVGFMPLFVAESAWKYNHRGDGSQFHGFMRSLFA